MDKLQFISVNASGLNTNEKRIKLYDWLRDSNIDIAILQGTHYVEKNEIIYNSRWFGKSIHNYSDSTFSRGVSILFKKDLPIDIDHLMDGNFLLMLNMKSLSLQLSIFMHRIMKTLELIFLNECQLSSVIIL